MTISNSRLVTAIALLAGIALRIHVYLRNPPLWIDEAMLTLNILRRDYASLMQPLDMNQGAPLGFLFAAKFLTLTFGDHERVLRLIPFLASLVTLAAGSLFSDRVLPLSTARLAIVLLALSPQLAGYAAEFKQYEVDAAIAAVLVCLGQAVWCSRGIETSIPAPSPRCGGGLGRGEGTGLEASRCQPHRWRLVALALAGPLAVWCSHPATFVLAGIGLAMLADAVARRDRSAVLGRSLVIITWIASFAACYLLFLRHLGGNGYLVTYWAGTFLPLPPRGPGDFAWLIDHLLAFFGNPGGFGFGTAGIAAFTYALGLLAWWHQNNWRLLIVLVTPVLLALLASGVKMYPFTARFLLFAVPLAIPAIAHGATWLAARLGRARFLLYALLLVGPTAECVQLVKKPLHDEDLRGVLNSVREQWQPGDGAYVYYAARPAFDYETRHQPFPAGTVTFGSDPRGKPHRALPDELRSLPAQPRVWIVMSHRQPSDEAAILATLDTLGRGEVVARGADAVAYRYDLSR